MNRRDIIIQEKMRVVISLYFLIQSLLVGVFIVNIYHSFANGFDTLLLMIDICVFVISLWNLFRKKHNKLVSFTGSVS